MKRNGLPTAFWWVLPVGFIVAAMVSPLAEKVKFLGNIGLLFLVIVGSVIAYFFYIKKTEINNPNSADSVYYFGFSLTIITLAASSIFHFGMMANGSGNAESLENLSLVFSQFGVGLIATCVGLVLRLYLIAQLDQEDSDDDTDEQDEQYARRQLIHDLGDFSQQLTQLHQSLLQNLQQQQNQFHAQMLQDFKQASTAILQEVRDTSIGVIQNIHDQKMLLEQAQMHIIDDALQHFKNRIKTTGKELAEIHTQMSQLKFEGISQHIHQSLGQLNHSLQQFSQDTLQNTQHVNHSLQQLSKVTVNTTQSVKEIAPQFEHISQAMTGYRVEVDTLTAGLQQTNLAWQMQQQRLDSHIQSLDQTLEHYQVVYEHYHQVSADAVKQSQESVEKVAQALTEVANAARQGL